MPQSHLRFLLFLLYAALTAAALWLLLPGLLPFLIALVPVFLLERPVRFLSTRVGLRRPWAAAVVLALFLLLLVGGCALLVRRVWYEVSLLGEQLPLLADAFRRLQHCAEQLLYRLQVAISPAARDALNAGLESLLSQLYATASDLSGKLLSGLADSLSALPAVVLFVFTVLLASFFMLSTRPTLADRLRRAIPSKWLTRLEDIAARLKGALGGWLRAQAILMVLTFVLLAAGFLLMGVDAALLLAAGTALLDALPVFGTGTVLLPWAAAQALSGRFRRCAALLVLYVVIWLTRNLLEPKLIADHAGLHPLAALFAMYMGFSLFGVAGMLLAPLAAVVIRQVYDSGLIPLRK